MVCVPVAGEHGHAGDLYFSITRHRVRSGWVGPLPVRYFCGECMQARECPCPCENRPAWHSWVYGGGDRPN